MRRSTPGALSHIRQKRNGFRIGGGGGKYSSHFALSLARETLGYIGFAIHGIVVTMQTPKNVIC